MGGSESKQPPGPPPLLSQPWRTLDWGKELRDGMKKDVKEFKISVPEVKYLRILIHGPVGAGKSSFINSIDSIFQERMTSRAIAEAATDHSCTKMYKAYEIKDGKNGPPLQFLLCDVMGLERGDSGVQIKDLIGILEGQVKDEYKFISTSPEGQGCYKNPELKDKIHCLVSVIPADTLLWCADKKRVPDHGAKGKDEEFIKKFKSLREHANSLGIPQVVLLSKVDEACSNVNEDVKRIYRSTTIKRKMQHCSNNVGIPMNCIFPLKNYHEEIHLNNDMDVLLLSAMKTILNFADDFVIHPKKKEGPISQLTSKLALKVSK